jgi:gas vesicle protein GvpO
VDVVELERVPSTTSVMCTYRLDLDADAHLTGFERVRWRSIKIPTAWPITCRLATARSSRARLSA